MKRELCLAGILCLLAGQLTAAEEEPRSVVDEVRQEDLQELAEALSASGQEEDIPTTGQRLGDPEGPWTGKLDLWNFWSEGQADPTGRLQTYFRGFEFRARVRPARESAEMGGATAAWDQGRWQVRAGGLGLTAAHGLLLAGPGRRPGLTASSSLGRPGVRLGGWGTTPEERSLFGLGLRLPLGGWSLNLVQGRPGENRPGSGLAALVLEKGIEGGHWSLAGLQAPSLQGVSLGGSLGREDRTLHGEAAWHRQAGDDRTQGSWLAGACWGRPRTLQVELQAAGSTAEDGPWTGQRPAVLSTWGGRGLALRLKAPLAPGYSGALLWGRSRGSQQMARLRRQSVETGEILLQGRPAPGWKVTGRWRRQLKRKWEWSELYPWLAADLVDEAPQQTLWFQVARKEPARSWRLAYRRLERGLGRDRVSRSLLEWKGWWNAMRGLEVVCHQGWAWGEAVDLVSAITPVPGLVRPRHWGRWSAETVLTLIWTRGGTRWAAGLSRRRATDESGEDDELSIWLSGKILW